MVRAWLLAVALLVTGVAGCLQSPQQVAPAATVASPAVAGGLAHIVAEDVMTFRQSNVTPAVGIAQDLYEPTLEVSDTGTIYVAAHVIGAATTGTPTYFSRDDGKTWAQLPFVASVAAPSPIQGAQPPPGDEGFLVAGDHGQAWMADIYAAGFSVTGWCDNGASQCYDNREAYDRAASTTSCTPTSLNDRPWSAYGNGTLLLVNNPGGGPMQIGVMKVPPDLPVGAVGVNGPTWNMCASEGGSIPGVPAMRKDGLFAVPQMMGSGEDQVLGVVIGNASDIMKVHTQKPFKVTSADDGTVNGGRAAFDHDGTLYVGAVNNTKDGAGRIILAISADGGNTFTNTTFAADNTVTSLFVDGNMAGPGALVAWGQLSQGDKTKTDWYVAHAFVGPDGTPVLRNVTAAVKNGPPYSAHVMGAAAGPDGRAYFINFFDAGMPGYVGSSPISVWIQKEGATLPVTAPVAKS
ncbi:MAG: hypothetical protein QOE90_3593 [Thermoplasmata archaeon]|jgi:hypothetical protein|nr:hypothetical protein [Thermoplasmata archaeon]